MKKNKKSIVEPDIEESYNHNVSNEIKNDNFKLHINRPISDETEDIIGVKSYVKSIGKAIDDGCNIISLSSKFGGGKSSVCKLLINTNKFGRTSTISLWDNILEGEINNFEEENNLLRFYKSFLFQLAADYSGDLYARYINKALNKSTGLINAYFRTKKIINSFFGLLLIIASYFILDCIPNLQDIIDALNYILIFDISITFLKYSFLLIGSFILVYIITNGRIVYTSWKSEKNRVLTIEDVISLYSDIISDTTSTDKKNLIIIEDIDRCISGEEKECNKKIQIVKEFIRSTVKLAHYDCSDDGLKQKLKNIVFIFCLDESKFIDKNDSDEFLKLFELRIDLGFVYFENYSKIFEKLLLEHNLSDENIKDIQVLLNSNQNSIRLLKNEINDCLIKYNILVERFCEQEDIKDEEKKAIKFKGCIAYAFLKNNFPVDFYKMIGDFKNVELIKNYLEKKADLSISDTNPDFNSKLKQFIDMGFLDEQFLLYLYNYPKGEKCITIYEYEFNQFIKGKSNLNIENNKKVSIEYILETQKNVNNSKLNYPDGILLDPYILSSILLLDFDEQLYNLIFKKFIINNDENIENGIEFIDCCIVNKIKSNLLLKYFDKMYKNNKINNQILNSKKFYNYRKKLTSYFKNDIKYFNYFFSGNYESINKEEYDYIDDKTIIIDLINTLKFNKDLEDIIPSIINFLDLNDNIRLLKFWENNVIETEKYISYAIQLLKDLEEYNYDILKCLEGYYDLLKNNTVFKKYINKIILKSTLEQLKKINDHDICTCLDDESVMYFLKHDLGRTPLIYLLWNEKFNEIENLEFKFITRFNALIDIKYDYLINSIIKFKKYILYNSNTNKFDYLFSEERFSKYSFDIEWQNVKNINLLFKCNTNTINNILKYVEEGYQKTNEELKSFLEYVNSYSQSIDLEKSGLLMKIFDKYSNTCKEISNESDIFERIIEKIKNDYKYKIIIKYMICCEKLKNDYCIMLQNYYGIEKEEYVEYINSLDPALINKEILKSLNVIYQYNKNIIQMFKENKMIKNYIGSSIVSENNYNREYIKQLNDNEFIELFNHRDEIKIDFLANTYSLNRIIGLNLLNSIDIEIIKKVLKKTKFNYYIFIPLFGKLQEKRIQQLLLSLEKLNNVESSNLIYGLSCLDNCKRVINNIKEIEEHIKEIIPLSYKHVYTKKIK